MKIELALKEIGLSQNEIDVYLALVKIHSPQPASIIASKLKMNRTTVYKILLQLAKKGFVAKTQKQGILSFYIENPEEQITRYIEQKTKRLKKANQSILDQLSLLMVDDQFASDLPKIRYYEGLQGLKEVYEAMLKEEEDYFRYGDITKIFETMGDDFATDYIRRRKEMNVTAHAIMPYYDVMDKAKLKQKHKKDERQTMYIPEAFFTINDGEIRICGNKVAIISLREGSLIGVLIESQVITDMFKSIFMLTWKNHNQKAFKL